MRPLLKALVVSIVILAGEVTASAQLRPGINTTLQTTSTAAGSLLVGCALGASTGCTGGINAGPVIVNAGGINIVSDVPGVTTNKIYNSAGALMWSGAGITTGSGTIGTLAKWTSTSGLGNSIITESGASIAVAGSISDSVGTMATIRAGGIGISSQAQYDMFYASSATQLARVANGTTGQVWTATTSGAPGWGAGPAISTFSGCSGSGNSATNGAQNLALCSISGLTNVDRLLVKVSLYKTGATGPSVELYNSTDSVGIATSFNANAAQTYQVSYELSVDPQSNTNVQATSYRGVASTYTGTALNSTFVTNYTGSWNLALRIDNGTPAGGTFYYTYIVMKIAG